MILQGSPRGNGNTRALVDWFSEGAIAAGAEIEIIDTPSLNYKANGCTSCFSCQKTDMYE